MLVRVVLVLALCHANAWAWLECGENKFFNEETEQCQECSSCGEDLLTSRVCSGTQDTLCGIVNFSFLDINITGTHSSSNSNKKQENLPTVIESDEDEYWKNLAIALIAVVSVLTVVSTLIVMWECYVRKYNWLCKTVPTDQGDMAESGYVVIHGFIPPGNSTPPSLANGTTSLETHPFVSYHGPGASHQRSSAYKPKRRILNEYVDDVFESDDSGGSRTLRLPTIPEKSDSDGTDSVSSP